MAIERELEGSLALKWILASTALDYNSVVLEARALEWQEVRTHVGHKSPHLPKADSRNHCVTARERITRKS